MTPKMCRFSVMGIESLFLGAYAKQARVSLQKLFGGSDTFGQSARQIAPFAALSRFRTVLRFFSPGNHVLGSLN